MSIGTITKAPRLARLLYLCLLAFFPFSVHAQVGQYRTDFAVGVNGGYIMDRISFVPEVSQKMLGGLTGGLTLRYTCEKYFSSIYGRD